MRISDWSSDVCSSDLDIPRMTTLLGSQVRHQPSQSRNGLMLLFRGVRMRFFKYLALAILWVFPQSVAAAAKPHRIVSLNPCVDAALMRIADPGQIADTSQYSRPEERRVGKEGSRPLDLG